jgi:phosphoribosylformimino-5-aminoimidazole carboxamide ribotide isomerase
MNGIDMQIYPALDLLDGQCVRLKKGNFEHKTVYSSEPREVIQAIEDSGARYLHLVDLSGAKDPTKRQSQLIHQLISESRIKIQCGGGIRSLPEVRDLLHLGVDRVILGSIAVTDPALTLALLREFSPNRITLALDVQIDPDGSMKIATDGWKNSKAQNVFELIASYEKAGLSRVLCTDILRDGMMAGPNILLYQTLMEEFPRIEFQASGGVSSLQDLRGLKQAGIHSVIIGRALYEGNIVLEEALREC